MKKMKLHNFENLHKRHLKNPAFKKAWDKSERGDKFIRAVIDTRLRKKMSQKQLAEKIGTRQSAISRFESGSNKNPTIGLLHSLARALGVEVEIIFKNKI